MNIEKLTQKYSLAKQFSTGYGPSTLPLRNINYVQIFDSPSSNNDSFLGEKSGSPSVGETSVLDACVEGRPTFRPTSFRPPVFVQS